MSAKRRAETIAKFCIPVKDTPGVDKGPVGISSRLRPPTKPQQQPMEIDDDVDSGSDFTLGDDRSDGNRTEFDSDDEPQAKRRKAKGKGRAKEKPPVKSKILEALRELDGESNPRVMLISLKGTLFVSGNSVTLRLRRPVAGALGLNLTVANNVFL